MFHKSEIGQQQMTDSTESTSDTTLVTHHGGCHCGRVRFQVKAPRAVTVFDCNCSICSKKQNKHFIVPASNFTLVQGKDQLSTYTFNSHLAQHKFCKVCGVQSFYIPRSNQDGIGVMPHCIDDGTIKNTIIQYFDGKNWEETITTSDIKKFSQI